MYPDDQQLLLFKKDFTPDKWKKITNFREYVVAYIKKAKWKKGAEIGVRRGQLLCKLLEECPDLKMIGVDPWEKNKADMRDVHAQYERMIRRDVKKFGTRVTLYKLYSKQAAPLIEDRSLDFVFIDADHSYNNCKEDIQLWSLKVKQNGYLLGDDFERTPGVERAVKELLPQWELLSPNIWCSPNILKI